MKCHFTQVSYDFFKYKGKIKLTSKNYEESGEKYHCEKLRKKYSNDKDLLDLIVSNVFEDPSGWLGDLSDDTANDTLLEYKRRCQSLGHLFGLDCEKVAWKPSTEVFQMFLRKEISPESFLILSRLIPLVDRLDKTDDLLWKHLKGPLLKYNRFLVVDDLDRFRKILLEKL